MSPAQAHYYSQVVSDLAAIDALSAQAPCHRLHYLQMLTEKLAKAFFFGKAAPVSKTHSGFGRFIKHLMEEPRLAKDFGIRRRRDFTDYLSSIAGLVRSIERLAPALCGEGPNPEYPWPPPPQLPMAAPATHNFSLWRQLETAKGDKFLDFLRRLIEVFPSRF